MQASGKKDARVGCRKSHLSRRLKLSAGLPQRRLVSSSRPSLSGAYSRSTRNATQRRASCDSVDDAPQSCDEQTLHALQAATSPLAGICPLVQTAMHGAHAAHAPAADAVRRARTAWSIVTRVSGLCSWSWYLSAVSTPKVPPPPPRTANHRSANGGTGSVQGCHAHLLSQENLDAGHPRVTRSAVMHTCQLHADSSATGFELHIPSTRVVRAGS
jgi:hypothetical protein